MKKKTIITLSIVAVLVILVFAAISTYNSLVGLEENVGKQWSNVENQ